MTAHGRGNYVVRKQTLHTWTEHFRTSVLPKLDSSQPVVLVGHSIAPLFILHIAQTFDLRIELAIFAAPFLGELADGDWQIDAVNFSFYDTALDMKEVRGQLPHTITLYSDNDPYVDRSYSLEFAKKVEGAAILVKGAGHFNAEAGWTTAPLIFELARTV